MKAYLSLVNNFNNLNNSLTTDEGFNIKIKAIRKRSSTIILI